MTAIGEKALDVQVVVKKKSSPAAGTGRPARIIVTPGKIEVRAHENKFPSFTIKISEIVKPPKRPTGTQTTWFCLDFVQTASAKFSYVNFQVRDTSKLGLLADTVLYAWSAKSSEKDMFCDDAGGERMIAAPVHKPAPNAAVKPTQSTAGTIQTRGDRSKIKVDEEGSAHPEFNNDFDKSSATNPPQMSKAFTLQKMFDNENSDANGKGVTSMPPPSVQAQKRPAMKMKGTVTDKSYSSQARRSDENYKPVDKTIGLPEQSFYGSNKSNLIAPSPQRRASTVVVKNRRLEDQSNSVLVTPGWSSAAQPAQDDTKENDRENMRPGQNQKSLTSATAATAFDATIRKPSLNGSFGSLSSSTQPLSRMTNLNPKYVNPLKNARTDSWKSFKDWAFKEQENIGNSCYMNATMQILAACPIFVTHLHKAVDSLQKKSNTISTFDKLMAWLSGEGKGLERGPVKEPLLYGMRTIIKGLDAIFEEQGGSAQQDAEECLTALLGAVSDECTGQGFRKRDSGARRSLGLGYSPVKTPIKRMQSSQSDSPLESEPPVGDKRKKKMPASCDPVDLMEVKMRDVKRCTSCDDTNEKEAVEHRVHLGIVKEEKDEDKPWTVKCVRQLLAAEVAQEEIICDFKCEKCLKTSEAIGTKQFVQFGEYIVIVLKRFGYDENAHLRKLDTPIRVPLYLEMADYIQDKKQNSGKRDRMDETITIEESQEKAKRKASNLVQNKTDEWMIDEGDDEEDLKELKENAESSMSDSVDFLDDEDRENERKNKDAGRNEENKEVKKEQKRAPSPKPQPMDDCERITTPNKMRPSSPASSPDLVPLEVTPVRGTTSRQRRAPTPAFTATVGSRKIANDVKKSTQQCLFVEQTTPSRKRRRQRANTVQEDEGEKWLSTSNRSTVCHSEPSRNEKKSRMDRRRASKFSPIKDNDGDVTVIAEVTTIDDSDDDKDKDGEKNGRRSLESAKATPVWKTGNVSEKKKETDDAFAFSCDDEEKMETQTGKMNKRGRGSAGGGPPGKKAPLTDQNGPKQDTPAKKAVTIRTNEKSENISPSSKSSMEQTGGGGRKRHEQQRKMISVSDESEVDGKNSEEDEDEEEKMEVDMVEDEKSHDAERDRRVGNVIERSDARKLKMTRYELKNEEEMNENEDEDIEEDDEEETDCNSLDGEKGTTEDDEEEVEGKSASNEKQKEKKESGQVSQEEFGSAEGGFVKEDRDSSADEVVCASPPVEEDEAKQGDERMNQAGDRIESERNEEKEEEEEVTLKEELEVMEKEDEETVKTGNESAAMEASALLNEASCFDTTVSSHRRASNVLVEEGEEEEEIDESENGITKEQKEEENHGDEDNEEMEGEERQKEDASDTKEVEDEKEMTEEEREAANAEKVKKLLKKKDKQRQEWRALFADTDPPPPKDHIMFRPVDDRWMRSQCRLLQMTYSHEHSAPPHLGELRAQSTLCQVNTAPADTIAIDGDGNCLFRAISWWVTGSEEDYTLMRKRIVEFMFNFSEVFGRRTTGADEQPYTRENNNRMLDDGEWGTQCEIYGAATLLGVDIYTYHESRWKAYRPLFEWTNADGYSITRKTEPGERTRYGIYLENDMNLHFDVVRYIKPVAPASDTCYRLLGSILHHGRTACSGHYVADVYDQTRKQWLHCDDEKITKRKIIEVLENAMNNGYVLVYGRNKSTIKKKDESDC